MKTNLDFTNFTIDATTKSTIVNSLTKAYEKSANSSFKRLVISKTWNLLFTTILVIFGVISVLLYFNNKHKNSIVLIIVFSISIIIVVISIIALTWSYMIKAAIKANFSTIAMLQYYQFVAKSNSKVLDITSISNTFTLAPTEFLPNTSFSDHVTIENVIAGYYLNQEFNLGTMFHEVIENSYSSEENDIIYYYHRYLFFTITIPEYDFQTVIKPETFFSKFWQRNKIKLESAAFEKIFLLDYQEPIKLRKLLTPKVMDQMLDYTNLTKKVPFIHITNNCVTVMLPYYNISQSDEVAKLVNFNIDSEIENTLNSITTTIVSDLKVVVMMVNWIKSLDLIH